MKLRTLSHTRTLASQNGTIGICLKNQRYRTRGFNLVETLITMALLVMVVIAAISSMTLLQRSSSRQSQYATAMQLAQGKLDSILALEYQPPTDPFGATTYYESNYVLLTEGKSGAAPSSPPPTPAPKLTPAELDKAIKDAEKVLKSAESAAKKATDAAVKAAADAAKAAADAAKKPGDTKKAAAAATAAAAAAAAQVAADQADAAVAAASTALAALTNPAPSPTPAQPSSGATMATVLTTVEHVENGHVVTVEVEFMNYNQPTTLRLQTLVNKFSGGQPL